MATDNKTEEEKVEELVAMIDKLMEKATDM